MSVPDFMARGRDSDVAPSRAPVPKILDQRPDGNGYVLVTFALPGLLRWTVRVPVSAWLNGEHVHLAAHADTALASFLPRPPAQEEDQLGGESAQQDDDE